MNNVCMAVRTILSLTRESPATNGAFGLGPNASRGRRFSASPLISLLVRSFAPGLAGPPRRIDAAVASEPYTCEASRNDVVKLVCWRGLLTLFPVFASKSDLG